VHYPSVAVAVMALGSRLPQIVLNMRRGNAGMLSVTTCLLNVAGNAARIFTTIVLTGDLLMLGGACSQGKGAPWCGVLCCSVRLWLAVSCWEALWCVVVCTIVACGVCLFEAACFTDGQPVGGVRIWQCDVYLVEELTTWPA
jgi:hypothetical protein